MANIILILGDQLSELISSLEGYNSETDIILMCEIQQEFTYVKHHKKKIAFIISAMRHFAEQLKQSDYNIKYVKLNDFNNSGSFKDEINKIINSGQKFDKIIVTYPGDYSQLQEINKWQSELDIAVEVREDNRFLCSIDEFSTWAKDRKQLRMEFFYRQMRKKYNILMQNDQPAGGKWNYDPENRKVPKGHLNIPTPYVGKVDSTTQEVISLVDEKFNDHFGDLEPFYFAVTRRDALQCLEQFLVERLPNFGDYQDAMIQNEPWMYHSHLSFYINCGLLLPMECIKAAEDAYQQGAAPLNSVEGFIRQILGWREYVRGIYWLKMPEYSELNYLEATKKLPEFYWTGDTKMNCLRQCVLETKKNAYAHHIQRLMVLGNFALIAGINPYEVNEWFLIVYADAYEWVELPNVSGMILFADGGILGSKPYAAGGGYINKMSNYCKNCSYKVSKKHGSEACPFNYLYWDFLARNRNKLKNNQRLQMMYKVYDRMDGAQKRAIENDSKNFILS